MMVLIDNDLSYHNDQKFIFRSKTRINVIVVTNVSSVFTAYSQYYNWCLSIQPVHCLLFSSSFTAVCTYQSTLISRSFSSSSSSLNLYVGMYNVNKKTGSDMKSYIRLSKVDQLIGFTYVYSFNSIVISRYHISVWFRWNHLGDVQRNVWFALLHLEKCNTI